MKEKNLKVELRAEIISTFVDYRDMSRYIHLACFVDNKLTDILIINTECED